MTNDIIQKRIESSIKHEKRIVILPMVKVHNIVCNCIDVENSRSFHLRFRDDLRFDYWFKNDVLINYKNRTEEYLGLYFTSSNIVEDIELILEIFKNWMIDLYSQSEMDKYLEGCFQ